MLEWWIILAIWSRKAPKEGSRRNAESTKTMTQTGSNAKVSPIGCCAWIVISSNSPTLQRKGKRQKNDKWRSVWRALQSWFHHHQPPTHDLTSNYYAFVINIDEQSTSRDWAVIFSGYEGGKLVMARETARCCHPGLDNTRISRMTYTILFLLLRAILEWWK